MVSSEVAMDNRLEIYLYGGCSSCRSADAVLAASGKSYHRRDFFKDPFTVREFAALLVRTGVLPHEILSTRSRAFRDLGLRDKRRSDAQLLELMVKHPTLLRRPFTVSGGKAVVGFKRKEIEGLIAAA